MQSSPTPNLRGVVQISVMGHGLAAPYAKGPANTGTHAANGALEAKRLSAHDDHHHPLSPPTLPTPAPPPPPPLPQPPLIPPLPHPFWDSHALQRRSTEGVTKQTTAAAEALHTLGRAPRPGRCRPSGQAAARNPKGPKRLGRQQSRKATQRSPQATAATQPDTNAATRPWSLVRPEDMIHAFAFLNQSVCCISPTYSSKRFAYAALPLRSLNQIRFPTDK